jgi:hypothetical protein
VATRNADATVMRLPPRRNSSWSAVLAVALLAVGCGSEEISASGKLSADETEAFLEKAEKELDYECAAVSGDWDYECVFTRDGERLKIGVDVNSTQPTMSSGYIAADMSFEEAERASQEAIDGRWYAQVRELCAGAVRDLATLPEPDTFKNTKSRLAGLYALSVRFQKDLSSLPAPAGEQKRVDRMVMLLGQDVEEGRKLYDAVAQHDRATADRLLRRLELRGREEAQILASFGC